MSLYVVQPGPQTTIQAGRRVGARRFGVPAAGPADGLSHALANRLCANAAEAPALEIALGGARFRFKAPTRFAITGAPAALSLNGARVEPHRTQTAAAGDELTIGGAQAGARLYLAVAGGFDATTFLGSSSTYLPARLGGHDGRALAADDLLQFGDEAAAGADLETPPPLRPVIANSWLLRATPSADTPDLEPAAREALFSQTFRVSRAADRMGVRLEGAALALRSDGRMPSAAAFPGLIQCPADGAPIILGADAQTTGGYPRIAAVIRADRHLIGQLRPGDAVRFLETTPDDAVSILREKTRLIEAFAPGARALL